MVSKIQMLLQGVNTKKAGIGVAAFCGGFGLGYILAKPRQTEIVVEPEVELSPEDLAMKAYQDAIIESLRNTEYSEIVTEYQSPTTDIVVSPPTQDPSIIAVDLEKIRHRDALIEEHGFDEGMRIYQEEYSMGTEIPVETPEETDDVEPINIFASEDTEWDQAAEELRRAETSGPYVLHKDEFWSSETGYNQNTLTYYAGDEMLCSEDGSLVYNLPQVVGELQFGHGSGDRNVVYIRNDELKAEYEIIRDRGQYRIEILGMDAEEEQDRNQLKHSIRRFRQDD